MPGILLYLSGEQPAFLIFQEENPWIEAWDARSVRDKWLCRGPVQSTYLQLLIGRRVQIILLELEKAELLTFNSWGRFIEPCFQWITELKFKLIYPLYLRRPQCPRLSLRILFPFQKVLLTTGNSTADSQTVKTVVQGEGLWEAWALLQKQGEVLLPASSGMRV